MEYGKVVRGADGKFYREAIQRDGSCEYIEVRDVEEHLKQAHHESHRPFFETLAEDKQRVRRQKALSRQVELAAQRAEPGAHGQVKLIKDEEFFNYQAMYAQALAKGEEKECPFQPLATYAHNITKARPILQGEVGMYGWDILRLEAGYGTGQLVQVGAELAEPLRVVRAVEGEVKEIEVTLSYETKAGNHE